ncbi:hypothetical protein ACN47E_004253 [Coniothyrium glycines]
MALDVSYGSNTTYKYAPLPGLRYTRLFNLYFGTGDQPIIGELQQVDLEACTAAEGTGNSLDYEALSYEWGSPELSHEVYIIDSAGNLAALRITRSLHQALCDLRLSIKSPQPRVIWADALCINQSDIEERQRQVKIMGSIYREAAQVVTYVGPADEDTAMAIAFIRELEPWKALMAPLETESCLQSIPSPDHPRCIALRRLMLKGWAGRSWCAQEFLLNENLVVMCGQHEFEWELIPCMVQAVFNRSFPSYLLPHTAEDPQGLRECLATLLHLRTFNQRYDVFPSLLDLLCSAYPMQASDPRDKIYSLLSLAADANNLNVPIDYTASAASLYTIVAASMVNQGQQILDWNLGLKSLELPSWVPDWSKWRYGSNGMLAGQYNAAGNTGLCMSIIQGKKLVLAGCVIDTISYVGEKIGPRFTMPFRESHQAYSEHSLSLNDLGEDTMSTIDWLDEVFTLAAGLMPYPDGTDSKELVWRTLTGNKTVWVWAGPPGKEYGRAFEAFCEVIAKTPAERCHLQARDEGYALAEEFHDNVRRRMRYRRLCVSERGYFGAVPEEAQKGDRLCIVEGTEKLYVVRGVGLEPKEFRLIGPAYAHGLMDGEALQFACYERDTIVLV